MLRTAYGQPINFHCGNHKMVVYAHGVIKLTRKEKKSAQADRKCQMS